MLNALVIKVFHVGFLIHTGYYGGLGEKLPESSLKFKVYFVRNVLI